MQKLMKAALALLVTLLLLPGPAGAEMSLLQVHQIDVGCADAYLIRCGEYAFMIDGGTEHRPKTTEMLDYLAQAGFDKLDACFVTHYHGDHVGNINLILEQFGDENTVVYGPTELMAKEYRNLPNGTYQQLKNFDELQYGDIHFTCVGPDTIDGHGHVNRDSLNFVMTYGSRRFLFTGDFVRGLSVIRDHEELVKDIDVFKFPHHGLVPYCVDAWVVEILQPEIILVPGVSELNVRDMLKKRKIPEGEILGYSNGHVVLLSDGETLEIVRHAEPGQFAAN